MNKLLGMTMAGTILLGLFSSICISQDKNNEKELLKDYKGDIVISESLYSTYEELIKTFTSGDSGEIKQFCLPGSITFTTDARPVGHTEYGTDINLQFVKTQFQKNILNLRKDSNSVYLIRTGSSYLYFVETKNDGWKLYHYGDKPIE